MEKELEKQILEVCEVYRESELYELIKEKMMYLVSYANNSQAMIDYLKDSFDEDKRMNDPMHMLGYLDILKSIGGNPYIPDLQLRNWPKEHS